MEVKAETLTVHGMPGHWHTSLELPDGYQHYSWYRQGWNPGGVYLDEPQTLLVALRNDTSDAYLYTQHQIFLDGGILKHTRSSPNWEGGTVTYATCKHLMRAAQRPWLGVWLAGLCPKQCAGNTVLFVGRVQKTFPGNYLLGRHLKAEHLNAWQAKQAENNPRGDLYTPRRTHVLLACDTYNHRNFVEPANHTRSVEFYSKSPGSVSDRPDGKVPKWWRDLEYVQRGRRPPCFVLSPCWVFSRPTLWVARSPGRAALRLDGCTLAQLLQSAPPG
jgi:hypothetical protein